MISLLFKHTVRLVGCAILLLALGSQTHPVYGQAGDVDEYFWSEWASITDGFQDLILYRTVTHPDTNNLSGFRTEYEVHNQYGFSVEISIQVTVEDAAGNLFDYHVEVHIGPDTTVQGTVDAEYILTITSEDLSIHAGDPYPF